MSTEGNSINSIDRELMKIKPSELLQPYNKSTNTSRQKSDNSQKDLIKIHEFNRDTRQDPFESTEIKDYFAFTNDKDKKYDFLKVNYLVKYNNFDILKVENSYKSHLLVNCNRICFFLA